MEPFDELEARYSGIISHALYELRTSGATADEIWERLDEIREEYLAEYEKLCFTTMKHEIEALEKKSPSLDGLSYFNPHITSMSSHISRVASLSK
jgi:hypothetical protein